jgi:hypothetical protein
LEDTLAGELGISRETVRTARGSGDKYLSPDEFPEKRLGLDGKSYPVPEICFEIVRVNLNFLFCKIFGLTKVDKVNLIRARGRARQRLPGSVPDPV